MGEECCNTEQKTGSKELIGNITCPDCKHIQQMKIPTNACQAFYKCEGCKKINMAKKSCCVFCDWGDRPCPIAKQHARA